MPVQGPSLRDSRLHVALTVTTLHVVGQVALDFSVSVPQIAACLLVCAGVDLVLVARRERVLRWPASALLTGNGIAFILRSAGTEHGQWWSTDSLWVFVGAASVAMAVKHLVRVQGRPLFNPANLAIVATLLLLGPERVHPLDLWWGPPSAGLAVAYAVLVLGGLTVVLRLGLGRVTLAFWCTTAVAWAAVVASGHSISARWAAGPVAGGDLWWIVMTSPELVLFAFFMVTEPRALPVATTARTAFGVLVGVLATGLMSTQDTEYGTKVALLAGLTLAYLTRPLLDRRHVPLPATVSGPPPVGSRRPLRPGVVVGVAAALGVAASVVGVTSPGPLGDRTSTTDASSGSDVALVQDVGRLPVYLPAATARDVLDDVTSSLAAARSRLGSGDPVAAAGVTTGLLRLELLGPAPDAARLLLTQAGAPAGPAILRVERSGVGTQDPPTMWVLTGGTEYLVRHDGQRYLVAGVRPGAGAAS